MATQSGHGSGPPRKVVQKNRKGALAPGMVRLDGALKTCLDFEIA